MLDDKCLHFVIPFKINRLFAINLMNCFNFINNCMACSMQKNISSLLRSTEKRSVLIFLFI